MWIQKDLPGFGASCRRRRRALSLLAGHILFARGDGSALTPTAWLGLVGLFALVGQSEDLGLLLLPSICLFLCLCVIAIFDARYFVIPDGPMIIMSLSAPLAWLGLNPGDVLWRFLAAATGYAALRLVALAYEWIRGNEGIGEGDARLYAVAGLWLGFPGLPGCLIYAALSALLSALIALRRGTIADIRAPLPFGPHLALGLWFSFVFGPLEFG
jgi:leader peptidase (prepilin peptidase) / N-methyltransferase